MAQRIRAVVVQAWRLEFVPQKPHEGARCEERTNCITSFSRLCTWLRLVIPSHAAHTHIHNNNK